jgi:Zn-dependent peptidase ImmA (M78 family)/DNA-binding XRE family transcriptional regulator
MSIGERLKSARIMAGMSQRALASEVEVSAQAISKYERDMDIPSSGILLKLASSLGIKTEYFFRPEIISVENLAYRKRVSLPTKEAKRVLYRIREWLERYIEIEQILGIKQCFDRMNFPVSSLEDVEAAAAALRDKWNLGLHPIDNLTEALEENTIKVGLFGGPGDFDACLAWTDDRTPVIALKKDLCGDRQRFNLAHELGHICLQNRTNIDTEQLAHRFAGAFLVPESNVYDEIGRHRNHISIYELHMLKHKYGLSMQGWIYRARDLGVISESRAQGYFRKFRRRGRYLREPGDQLPPEQPRRFDRLVIRAFSEQVITQARAAELLGRTLQNFYEEEAEQHGELVADIRD